MTAFCLLPTSCAALLAALAAAAAAADATPLGMAWRAAALVGALQLGFVVGATSNRAAGEIERRARDKVRADASFFRAGRRFFRGGVRGGAKGGL
ncbi:hypothetical protein [Methylocella sp.]|uniref:hypothetical protein n=1 Tax=Methylocella sp. TaxID=1978226 RepID=UPI003782F927